MHAAVFDAPGPPEVVEYREVDVPSPGQGEVLIQVGAAAMNHLDLWVRRGLPIETTMPHIGGSDVAGIVVEAGDETARTLLGTRVVVNPGLSCGTCRECISGQQSLCPDFRILGEHTDGGFADFVVAPIANLHLIPDHVSFETAATLPVSYSTAWRALISRARVRAGEDVLVIGASGGTAIAAIQIAKLAGARVLAVTSGAHNVRRVKELGAEVVYDRLEVDFARALHADTRRRGVDIVVENVGAPTWESSIRSLAPGGRLVTYGATAGPAAEIDLRRLFWRQLEIIGTTMSSNAEFAAMLRVAFSGALSPVIDEILPLSQAPAAHSRLETGTHFGKLILVP